MPPPLLPPPTAELPDRVLLLTVSVPTLLKMPPRSPELPARVLLLTVSVPPLTMPPPTPAPTFGLGTVAELPDRVLPVTVAVPALEKMHKPPPIPPPSKKPLTPAGPPVTWSEAMVLEATVREPPFTYKPPPCAAPPRPPK